MRTLPDSGGRPSVKAGQTGRNLSGARLVLTSRNPEVPDFSDRSTSDGASWSTMAQAIASDLRASGRFALIQSNLPTEGRADALPHFDRWRGTDAKWLVIGRVIRVVLTVRGSLPVYPNNRTSSERFACRKSANNGLMHRSKPCRHSITSLAWASSNCGTSRPSEKALTPSHPRLPSTPWYQLSAVLKS
jgi:hypothetical protein